MIYKGSLFKYMKISERLNDLKYSLRTNYFSLINTLMIDNNNNNKMQKLILTEISFICSKLFWPLVNTLSNVSTHTPGKFQPLTFSKTPLLFQNYLNSQYLKCITKFQATFLFKR